MIVCGWTRYPSPQTLAAISAFPFTLADVCSSDEAYHELLSAWWSSTEQDLIVCEHDIEPSVELIQELLDCPRPWCAALYSFEERWLIGLGLTKFNLRIRTAVPDLFEQMATMEDEHHPPKHWCRVDARMQNLLAMQSGQSYHVHEGPIVHTSKLRSHVACRPSAL